jgi:amino acid adenylation domain-containing protein
VTAEQLLSELRTLDIRLSVDGDRLRCTAPQGRITRELEQRIAAAKPELLRVLSGAAPQAAAIPRYSGSRASLPLSSAQERFWFLQNFYPDSPAYNITALRHIHTPVDVKALEWALDTVRERHEILRTGFREADGSPVQVIHEHVPAEIAVYNLEHLHETGKAAALESGIREVASQKFDLAGGSLLRLALFRLEETEHCLLAAMHHLICDAWSIGILMAELKGFYEERTGGKRFPSTRLALQYGDYAVWEKERQSSGVLAPKIEYWKKKLKDVPPHLDLPLDRPRSTATEYTARHRRFALGATQSELLRGLLQQESVTPYMLMLAVFQALLFRYSKQRTVVAGTPVSMRNRVELENVIGCLINTHALRADFPPGITTRQLLDQVRTTVLECLSHDDVPFETVLGELMKERDLSRSPLLQVAFFLQNTPLAAGYEIVSGGTTFDMTLYMWERNGVFSGSIEYNANLFDEETIACFAGCFETLAAAMASGPDTAIERLPLLTAAQESEWFERYSGQALSFPEGYTHEWIERRASETPAATAVICGEETLSYGDVSERSNRLASRLRALGVDAGSLVAICLERSPDLIVASLAVWKAGGAYIPLDPDFPPGRLHFMLADSGATVLITEEHLLKRLPRVTAHTICTDRERNLLQSGPSAMPPSLPDADRLAYVIYTSGSTGQPKGVEVTHRSLANLLASMQREPGMGTNERLLAVTTFSFDIAALELYLPLISGGQVVIAENSVTRDGPALARLIDAEKITVMQATPVTWRLLLQSGWRGSPGLKALCGGEALSRELARQLITTGCELWNLYGPTETTIWSTLDRVRHADRLSIGHPVANTQIHVLDERGEPLPPGVPGELYIGGAGLARGYLRRQELTAERFIESPRHGGARLYRTGDLARRLSDGRLEWLGRLDAQVKLRGFRIEPGEIEAVLEQQESVDNAVVAVRRDAAQEERLVAYLTAKGPAEPRSSDLRRALQKHLPDYMIPAEFVVLAEFPLTANRKVDREALLAAEYDPRDRSQSGRARGNIGQDGGESFVAPSNHVESVMSAIWSEVLGVERVSVHDNFFELGGNSLSAMRLIARLRSELGMEMPLRCIFISPTIASLASHISYVPAELGYRYTSEVPEWNCLVPVQPKGTRTPLFFVAGFQSADDTLFVLSHLIPHLGLDQPVFGFRPRWTQGGADYASVDELVQEFLTELRAVQPHGPYLLGGWCVGGIAALELAAALTRQGEEVKMLLLIDTERPSTMKTLATDIFFMRQRASHMADVVTQIARADGRAMLRMAGELARRKAGVAQTVESREQDRFYQSKVRYRRLLYAHSPEQYAGQMTLISTQDGERSRKGLGWAGFAVGGLSVHAFPGDHDAIFKDHSEAIAEVIQVASGEEARGKQRQIQRPEAKSA